MTKRAYLLFVSTLLLLLVGSTGFAAGPKGVRPAKAAPVHLEEVHSPLERTGTWTSEPTPWPENGAPEDVNADGLGFWYGGYYYEIVSNTLLENNVSRDQAEAFKMLGRGVCMDTTETTSLTGSISISGEAKFSDAIKASFGFSGSGTRTFTVTYKYCGPSESSPYPYRYFYKQLIYNKYQSSVLRLYYTWWGTFHHVESGLSTVLVPYMATFSQDSDS
ncbi:MAG TPA: hypothetical protein VD969_00385 [Symbiobacteriaceae bacterium]|nr:hypothetical protein [Symbiobacteriaceae bacterium]